jgi:hypothetical protein
MEAVESRADGVQAAPQQPLHRLAGTALLDKHRQKTRPSTQYTVNDLASPGY